MASIAARSAATSPWRISASSAPGLLGVRRLGHRHLGRRAGDGAAVAAPAPVEVGVADDGQQPRLDLAAAAGVDAAIGLEQRLLGDVLGRGGVAGQVAGQASRPHRCAAKSVRGTAAPQRDGERRRGSGRLGAAGAAAGSRTEPCRARSTRGRGPSGTEGVDRSYALRGAGDHEAWRLLDHYLADHLRVDRAEVAVNARLGEGEGCSCRRCPSPWSGTSRRRRAPCAGMSSLLVHFTVVPAATVMVGGEKVKLSMFTALAAGPWASATPRAPKPSMAASGRAGGQGGDRHRRILLLGFSRLGEGLVDDRRGRARGRRS